MSQLNTSKRVSNELAVLFANHASELTLLEARQHNERVDMQERHATEVAALQNKPIVSGVAEVSPGLLRVVDDIKPATS